MIGKTIKIKKKKREGIMIVETWKAIEEYKRFMLFCKVVKGVENRNIRQCISKVELMQRGFYCA